MADRTPIETKNLDIYGNAPLPWSRPHDLFAAGIFFGRPAFLGTTRPDGRPHAAGIGALWLDGDIYFTSGPGTRKSRNLAASPACTISASLATIDIVLEGEAVRVTDEPTLERVQNPISEPQEPVSWRVAYTAFGLEGVNDDTGYNTRQDLLGTLFDWLDDEVAVSFDQDAYFVARPFGIAQLSASLTSSLMADAVYYRWDYGDGSDFEYTAESATEHQYQACGFYQAQVEAMDEFGHKAVSEPVQVEVCTHIYLPLAYR